MRATKVLLIGVLMLFARAVGAQEAPLVLWVAGDLWSVRDDALTPEPITESGYISGPVLAPTGDRIAYKAAAAVGIEALDRVEATGLIAEYDLPGDILVLDIATGGSTLVAGQPENALLFVEGAADNATVRSAPAWSPDGAALAWTEFPFGGAAAQLVRADLATGAQQVIVPQIDAVIARGTAPDLRWGEAGFAVRSYTLDSTEQVFLFYAQDGALQATARVQPGDDEDVLDFVWVDTSAGSRLGVLFTNGRWLLIDPLMGTGEEPATAPQLYSLLAPDSSLRLRFGGVHRFSRHAGDTLALRTRNRLHRLSDLWRGGNPTRWDAVRNSRHREWWVIGGCGAVGGNRMGAIVLD
jgi:hypothetical protein